MQISMYVCNKFVLIGYEENIKKNRRILANNDDLFKVIKI